MSKVTLVTAQEKLFFISLGEPVVQVISGAGIENETLMLEPNHSYGHQLIVRNNSTNTGADAEIYKRGRFDYGTRAGPLTVNDNQESPARFTFNGALTHINITVKRVNLTEK